MGPCVVEPSPDDVRETKVPISQNRKFCVSRMEKRASSSRTIRRAVRHEWSYAGPIQGSPSHDDLLSSPLILSSSSSHHLGIKKLMGCTRLKRGVVTGASPRCIPGSMGAQSWVAVARASENFSQTNSIIAVKEGVGSGRRIVLPSPTDRVSIPAMDGGGTSGGR